MKNISIIVMCLVLCQAFVTIADDASNDIPIYKFELRGENSERKAVFSWPSEIDSNYVVEEAETLDGDWTVSSDSILATDFLSTGSVMAPKESGFFRIKQVDCDGPSIQFDSPTQDALAVPTDSEIRISVEDISGIDESSIRLYIDNELVDHDLIVVEDGTIVYSPSTGVLGEGGQEIAIMLTCSDLNGNESTALSTIRLERPLTITASSLFCVGDPELFSYSYCMVGGKKVEKPEITLAATEDDALVFTGATMADFSEGQYLASLVSTNIFYRKAVSVESLPNGLIRVGTVESDIGEMAEGSFSSSSMECVVYDDDGLPIGTINTKKSRTLLAASATTKKDADKDWFIPLEQKDIKVGKELSVALANDWGISFSKEVQIIVNGAYWVNGDIQKGSGVDFDFVYQGQIHIVETGSMSVMKELKSKTVNGKVKLFSYRIQLGTTPFWITMNASIDCILKADVSGGMSASAGVERYNIVRLHVQQRDGWIYCADDSVSDAWSDPLPSTMSTDAEGSLELAIGLRLDLRLCSAVGPYVFVGPYVKGTSTISASSAGISTSRKIVAGVKGVVGVGSLFTDDLELYSGSKYIVLYEDGDEYSAPKIVSFPTDKEYKVSDTISLVPEVSGSGTIMYSWLKDGYPIRQYSKDLSFTATKDSGGTYTLLVDSPYGSTSASVKITIDAPPTIADYVGKWKGKFLSTTHYLHVSPSGATTFKYPDGEGGYKTIFGYSRIMTIGNVSFLFFQSGGSWVAFRMTSSKKGESVASDNTKWTKLSDSP